MSAIDTDTISLTVPVGWSVVDLDGLLDPSTSSSIETAVCRSDENFTADDAASLKEDFQALRDQVDAEHLLFMAVRVHQPTEAYELMTLAVPGTTPLGEPLTDTGSTGRISNEGGAPHPKLVLDGEALIHRSHSEPGQAGGAWPTQVQVVLLIDRRLFGAVLTLLSSKAGSEEELEQEALLVARSLLPGAGPSETQTQSGAAR